MSWDAASWFYRNPDRHLTRIHVLRGARAGDVIELEGETIRVGRQADADLRFHPDADLEVSGVHALLYRSDAQWFVRDAGSTNGTFVNGARVTNDVALSHGDRIEFGAGGPLAEIRLGEDPATPEGQSRTRVLRAQYARKHRRLAIVALALGVALVVAAARLVIVGSESRRERAAWERERASLLGRIDTLLVTNDASVASLRGELDDLATELRKSETAVRETRAALERLPPQSNTDTVDRLRRQLRAATEALARQQLAASLDFRTIEQANRDAVALIYVEAQDGAVSTATAFSVRKDGTLITARHVITGADGSRQPRRIAVQFSDSEQFFPAQVASLSNDFDLAVLKVDNILGEVPVIAGFNTRSDTVGAGAPVAVIGYPLGGESEGPDGPPRKIARPLVTAAVVTALSGGLFEIQGYGAAGASGSPIVDSAGRVVAVLMGGISRDGRPLLVGVPSDAAVMLLQNAR
jgi:S1-C subfamily serine protease